MDYSVKDELLKQLVDLLRPVKRIDKPTQIIESLIYNSKICPSFIIFKL